MPAHGIDFLPQKTENMQKKRESRTMRMSRVVSLEPALKAFQPKNMIVGEAGQADDTVSN